MGFSVSGSFAIIALAALVAFGTFYPAVTNSYEDIRDAQQADYDGALERQNTDLTITTASWDLVNSELTIEATNDGTTELPVNTTDIIVDNTYITHEEIASNGNSSESIDGDTSTELWLPDETYEITLSDDLLDAIGVSTPPARVKLVTKPGVADTEEVT